MSASWTHPLPDYGWAQPLQDDLAYLNANKAGLLAGKLDPSQVPDLSGDYAALGGATFTGPVTAPVRDSGGQVFNVMAAPFNAVGDGVTDDSGAIQLAVSSASAAGSGVVVIPPGVTCAIGAQVSLMSGVTIIGDGATVKLLPSVTGRAFLMQNVSNCGINGLTIDLNKSATANANDNNQQQGVYVLNTGATDQSNITIRAKVVNGWKRGVSVTQTSTGKLSGVTLDIVADNLGDRVVHVDGTGSGANVTKVDVRVRSTNGGNSGVVLQSTSKSVVHDCDIDGAGSIGSLIVVGASGTGKDSHHVQVVNNRVSNVTGALWGIVATVKSSYVTVGGNEIINCGGGITFDPDDGSGAKVDMQSVIANNRILGTTNTNGINVRIAKGVAVTGNVVQGAFLNGIAISTSDNCSVTGNVVSGSLQSGIQVGESTPSGGHSFAGNTVSGSGVANYSVTATTPCKFATTSATPPA